MRDTERKRERKLHSFSVRMGGLSLPHLITRGGWRSVSTGCPGSSCGVEADPWKPFPATRLIFPKIIFHHASFLLEPYNWLMPKASASGSYLGLGSMLLLHQNLRAVGEGLFSLKTKDCCVLLLLSRFILKFQIRGRYCIFCYIEVEHRLND